ncbi:hypothetical protein GDO81_016434 [Engystomops pustulosus]|uniref:Interferon-induced transmembrane protein 3 n=2 Tax=Engystomops pustulosus TaxID=76066 RepID=A0AAV7AWE4_ENGPU|nr:hypothetical protein GDO81_016434 [Engystomops pustulosus]
MDSDGMSLPIFTNAHSGGLINSGHNLPGNAHSTVVVIQEDPQLIRDDLIWSIFNIIHCNAFCLGLVALSYSVKSRDRKLFKDYVGAREYGATARKFNIAALAVTVVVTFSLIIIYFTVIFTVFPRI